MTFAALRAFHAIIGTALDDMEAVYREASSPSSPISEEHSAQVTPVSTSYDTSSVPNGIPKASPQSSDHLSASPPSTPSVTNFHSTSSSPPWPLDFPSLDEPYDPSSPSETLNSHPTIMSAINRIVAAAGQMSMTVQTPFLSICDATMGYHLPSCMRLLEASHIVEILREAGPGGLHVQVIAEKTGIEKSKIAHSLRLLATHHFLREVAPDIFANNRITSLIDTGKAVSEIQQNPAAKYRGTNGISAFVGMCTDELQKSSAYITEAYLLSNDAHKNVDEPTHAPFNFAFGCEGVGFFSWLEGEGIDHGQVNGPGRPSQLLPNLKPSNVNSMINSNGFRLERFGIAMTGTDGWEVPGAVLSAFDWASLPMGSIVVDVGGGIGSTSMTLAHAFCTSISTNEDASGLKFVIQDRAVVVEMGLKAWREKCPELLDTGVAEFQAHDFFDPQPVRNAAVYFLRVILHDWPDNFARKILLRLREAAGEHTKLVMADFVLPLACADECDGDDILQGIVGAGASMVPEPLLPNLGKASAHGYWMDMTMQATFNGQERTLREIVALATSAGWKVVKVAKLPGSLFGHIVAVPVSIPLQKLRNAGLDIGALDYDRMLLERATSRVGTPTLGSRVELPSLEDPKTRSREGFFRSIGRRLGGSNKSAPKPSTAAVSKKKLSPLSISSPIYIAPSPRNSSQFHRDPINDSLPSPLSTHQSHMALASEEGFHTRSGSLISPSPSIAFGQTPPSPRQLSHHASFTMLNESPASPRSTPLSPITKRARSLLARRSGHAQVSNSPSPGSSLSPSPIPPVPPVPAPLTSPEVRKRPDVTDSPLPRQRSEGLLSLSPLRLRHSRNRSGGAGRKITFGDQLDDKDEIQQCPADSKSLLAPALIQKPRSKTRPASPF